MIISRQTQYTLAQLRVAYALIDDHYTIVEHDPSFPLWLMGLSEPLAGRSLLNVVPEFFGMEAELERIRRGEPSAWSLEHIHRDSVEGTSRYFTFTASRCVDSPHLLLVLAKDVTQQGMYLQQLMQSHNETQLLRQKVNKLNAQLNYFLDHYVDSQIVEGLLDGNIRPDLGGELRDLTVLFIDARGYTRLAEKHSPMEILELLNEYLGIIISIIDSHYGSVNQFAGDGVMALFNIHGDQPEHARLAVQAGIAIQKTLLAYRRRKSANALRLEFGIGINTGPAIVGNVGAQWHYTYTAIGATTNLASRITAVTPPYSVWMSRATYEALHGQIQATPLPPMRFKGKSEATQLYGIDLDAK